MTDPIAEPIDVRNRLGLPEEDKPESSISNDRIQTYLEDAAADNARVNNVARMDDATRKQIEWRLAAIKIYSYSKGDKAFHQQSMGTMSRSYEVRSVDELKAELDSWDPSGRLAHQDKRTASIDVPSTK